MGPQVIFTHSQVKEMDSQGEISIPNGAVVSDASFTLSGTSSSESYSNLTTDADFGGEGISSWQGPFPPNVNSAYRTSLEAKDDSIRLREAKSISQKILFKVRRLVLPGLFSSKYIRTICGKR